MTGGMTGRVTVSPKPPLFGKKDITESESCDMAWGGDGVLAGTS